ncbi:MAG: S9 family peptidase, partial [Pseudomonadales bacterium]|nr:S9 family peptidase [Pseudomonadales bacterium]
MTDFPRILPGCLMVALVLTLTACFDGSDKTKGPNPPVARVQDHIIEQHGLIRNDEYYWLRDDSRQDPEVLSLLAAENQYATDYMAPLSGLQDQIYREITARLTNDDRSLAINDGSYAYHREFVPGGEQPVYFRTLRNSNHKSEIILDQNRLSSGHAFYAVGSWRTSPDDKLLAFTEDTVGRNQFRLRFRNLDSGEFLPDSIANVSDSIAWSADSRWIFYVRQDEQTLLPRQVYRHRLGTPVASDVLVYEETDRAFYTTVSASRSRSLILISSDSIDASELQFIPADQPESAPQMFQRREAGHRFVVRHLDGNFYILSNRDAPEYRLMIAADTVRSEPEKWRELMPYRPQVSLTDLEVFDRYIAVGETEAGLPRIRVMDRSEPAMPGHLISFPDPSYHALLAFNHDHQSEVIRYAYSSLRAPDSVYEYHPGLDHSYLLKQDEVVGDFDPVNYTVERLWIDARDGERVPVSLVYRTGLFRKGENPLYLEAYG